MGNISKGSSRRDITNLGPTKLGSWEARDSSLVRFLGRERVGKRDPAPTDFL